MFLSKIICLHTLACFQIFLLITSNLCTILSYIVNLAIEYNFFSKLSHFKYSNLIPVIQKHLYSFKKQIIILRKELQLQVTIHSTNNLHKIKWFPVFPFNIHNYINQ